MYIHVKILRQNDCIIILFDVGVIVVCWMPPSNNFEWWNRNLTAILMLACDIMWSYCQRI